MRLFDEQVFERLNNKKIIIIGKPKGARLIRELLQFRGYETSMFLNLDAKDSFIGRIRNILGLRAVRMLGNRAVLFSSVVLSPGVEDELESAGIHSADIYDMTQYSGGGYSGVPLF